jgi:hypothetical protein
MDDGAALVREVLEDLPMEERGEREEWQRHQGWHRREETHRHPESSPLLPSKEEEPDWEPLPPVAAAKEEEEEEERLLPPAVIDIDAKEEAAIRQRIHEEVLAEERVEAAAKEAHRAAVAAAAPAAAVKADFLPGTPTAPIIEDRADRGAALSSATRSLPTWPTEARPHLRGAVLLPRSQDFPEEQPPGALWLHWTRFAISGAGLAAAACVLWRTFLARRCPRVRSRTGEPLESGLEALHRGGEPSSCCGAAVRGAMRQGASQGFNVSTAAERRFEAAAARTSFSKES